MDTELVKEAEQLGLNPSLYYMLPPDKRNSALKKDIENEKRLQKESDDG